MASKFKEYTPDDFSDPAWVYTIMYNHGISFSFHDPVKGFGGPSKGKDPKELRAWIMGAIDGIGDNPSLNPLEKRRVIDSILNNLRVGYPLSKDEMMEMLDLSYNLT